MRVGRDLDLAHRDFVRAEQLFEQIPDSAGLAYVVQQRGDLAWSRGDYAGARDAYERSVALAERMRAFRVVANSRSNLAMLGLAVRLVSSAREHGQVTLTRVLGTLTIALKLGSLFTEDPVIALADLAMSAVFYAHVIRCLLGYVLRDAVVTVDELFAATCTYVLLAMAFACVYAIQERLAPGSFSALAAPGTVTSERYWDLVYFSFTVLTSTGFGDIHPLARQARSFAVLEQVSGVMYVAILIARLTGTRPLRRQRDRDDKRPGGAPRT